MRSKLAIKFIKKEIFEGTPSRYCFSTTNYTYTKFGTFVSSVTVFLLSDLTRRSQTLGKKSVTTGGQIGGTSLWSRAGDTGAGWGWASELIAGIPGN